MKSLKLSVTVDLIGGNSSETFALRIAPGTLEGAEVFVLECLVLLMNLCSSSERARPDATKQLYIVSQGVENFLSFHFGILFRPIAEVSCYSEL